MQIPFLFDWKKSKAHHELLSRFITCESINYFTQDETVFSAWKEALGESPEKAIKRFINEEYLTKAEPSAVLDKVYKLPDLKSFCAERGLKVSGKKSELIERLMRIDESGLREITSQKPIYSCTQKGLAIAKAHISIKEKAQQGVAEALKKRDYFQAATLMIDFEKQQVFPRGMGINWKTINPKEFVQGLKQLFETTPDILLHIPEEKLNLLKEYAGAAYLWGGKAKLPSNMENVSEKYDNEVCLNMLTIYAMQRNTLANYGKNSDVVKGVRILLADDDACEECKKIGNKTYLIESGNIPQLPYYRCSNKKGCRCCYLPVTIGSRELRNV